MEKKAGSYEIVKEGNETVMKINCFGANFSASLEEDSRCMANVISNLIRRPVNRVVLIHRRNYSYDYEQTQMLVEISGLYNQIVKQRDISVMAAMYGDLRFVLGLLLSDPIGAYVELRRLLRESLDEEYKKVLMKILFILDKTKLINKVKGRLDGYVLGNRELYKKLLRPSVMPNFVFTRLMARQPLDGVELDSYEIENIRVSIFEVPNDVKYLYHIMPREFLISEDKYDLLDMAKVILSRHEPRAEEFIDPERMRQTFFNISKDLLIELSEREKIEMDLSEIDELAEMLVRYTVGFGFIEVLLKDKKIQDIVINGPIGETPVFVVHEDYGECVTNIIPSREDGVGWASRLRMLSGRPLDEANPVLDTELLLPWARARVAVITRPLSPNGLAYVLRRHRDEPWTYPLFIKGRMINSLAAGLLSFIIDGGRTMLFAGTRSSGKSSILGATMIEIMRKYKIISLEDTLELPTTSLRKLGYNIQTMKTRSALTKESSEMAADEGIRTSLRLGDSSLIIGEIRSKEAQALWEAMRIGALANVVAGTIHGADPYSVYDRVVNDLKVPKTSFKATDIIVISNPIKTADGMHKKRRVLQITEVRKHWEKDPLRENGFLDLMKYDSKEDTLKPSDDLINGESEVLKSIASNIKEYVGNWDAVWDNILLRARIKQTLVDYSIKLNKDSVLEAGFVILGNDTFHQISDRVREEVGYIDSKRVYFEWEEWLRREIKKDNMG